MADNRQLLKQQVTHQLIAWHQAEPENRLEYHNAFIMMWFNTRSTGGLRLTSLAYELLMKNQVTEYYFDFEKLGEFTNNLLFLLDKKLNTPYYVLIKGIKKPEPVGISLFGSEEAMMLSLQGDLKRFLELL